MLQAQCFFSLGDYNLAALHHCCYFLVTNLQFYLAQTGLYGYNLTLHIFLGVSFV